MISPLPHHPTRLTIREAVEDVAARASLEIGRLLWVFTRQARGRPPALVRPDLYETQARCRELLAALGRVTPAERDEGEARALASFCMKCGAAPDEPCVNVLDGGLCIRRRAS